MILHELYFDGLGDGGVPDTAFARGARRETSEVRIDGEQSSSRWGKAMGGGSGWVLLTYSLRDPQGS